MATRTLGDNNNAAATLFIQPQDVAEFYYLVTLVDMPSIMGSYTVYNFDSGTLSGDKTTLTYTYTYQEGVNPEPGDIGDESTLQTMAMAIYSDPDGTIFNAMTTVVVQPAAGLSASPPIKKGTVSVIRGITDVEGAGKINTKPLGRPHLKVLKDFAPGTVVWTTGALVIQSATLSEQYFVVGLTLCDENTYLFQMPGAIWEIQIQIENGYSFPPSAMFTPTQTQDGTGYSNTCLIGIMPSAGSGYASAFVAVQTNSPTNDGSNQPTAWLQNPYPPGYGPDITLSNGGFNSPVQL